jgi:hypothetical protein
MISMNAEIVATLNRLVRLNRASELGFETAAEHVKNRGLKLLLRSYARQRARFGEELSREIAKWGARCRSCATRWLHSTAAGSTSRRRSRLAVITKRRLSLANVRAASGLRSDNTSRPDRWFCPYQSMNSCSNGQTR